MLYSDHWPMAHQKVLPYPGAMGVGHMYRVLRTDTGSVQCCRCSTMGLPWGEQVEAGTEVSVEL